ncbi:MAG: rhodanese-like domain-containing protein [Saprospiraceae bacterium]
MKKLACFFLFFTWVFVACQTQTDSSNNNQVPTQQVTPYQDLSVATFKAKMSEPGVVLMDVRTPEETAEGKIEGAMELDFRSPDFAEKLDELDKEKTYLIYCRSGNRSGQTCDMMAKKGFKNLYNLDGGFMAWSSEK